MEEQFASRLEMNERWHPMIVMKVKTTTMRNWGPIRTMEFEHRVLDKKLVRLGQMMKPAICLVRILSVQPTFRLWDLTQEDIRREGGGNLTPADFILKYGEILGCASAVRNKEH